MNNLFSGNTNPNSLGGDENRITKDELFENHLTELDAQLATAGEAVRVPPDFQSRLQTKLYIAANRPAPKHQKNQARRSRHIGWAAIGLAVVALIFVFLLPALKPDNEVAQPEGDATEVAEQPTEAVAAENPTNQSPIKNLLLTFFGSTAQAQGGGSGSFGSDELTLTAAFPESPSEAAVYEQVVEDVTSAEQAKAFASQLGIEGEVFLIPYEGGGFSYVVTDGIQKVTIIKSTTYFTFSYTINSDTIISTNVSPLSFEDRRQVAESFLKERGLLNFNYQVSEPLSQTNRVVFTRVVDDYPLLITDNYNPFIQVSFDDVGNIDLMIYRLNNLNPVGTYPLRNAQEAWNLVLDNPNDKRVQYTITSPEMLLPLELPNWSRPYPIGQDVDIYSGIVVYDSAESSGEKLVTAGGFILEGDLDSLIAAKENPPALTEAQLEYVAEGVISEKQAYGWVWFYHIWGQSRQEENGARYLTVEGWEISPVPSEFHFGEFTTVNQKVVFIDENGQRWDIPDLPDGIPQDVKVVVKGVRDEEQTGLFHWDYIQVEPVEDPFSQGGGGGGGGGGPMEFSPDPDVTPEPTPEPLPMPYEVGEQIDGLVGTLTMQRIVRSDGSKVTEAYLGGYLPDDPERYQSYQLLDEDLSTLEGLNLLHLRVWGTFTLTENGLAAIQLEKAEKAYPEEEVQAWLGHHQVIELGGQLVLQFTDSLTGQQYILSRSLDMPAEYLTDPFNGAQCIIEGVLSQDTYAGLPMITDFSGSIALGVKDLSDYMIYSTQIYDQPEMPTTFTDQVTDGINIDSIQLVYFAYDLTQGGGGLAISESPVRFVQPVWRFSGTMADGQIIEILVQAVTDEYLH